jgi:predicted ATPase with chaperone activity
MAEDLSIKELIAEPTSISETQISQTILVDIILRLFRSEGNLGIRRIGRMVRIPKVIEDLLNHLLEERLIKVQRMNAGAGLLGYIYDLTEAGKTKAREATERSQYIGPAPVPIDVYNQVMELQCREARGVDADQVKEILSDMVLPKDFHRQIGPAANTISSLFIYGPSGNGKTAIAKKIAELIASTEPIWIPYAIETGGEIIQIYDQLVHEKVEVEKHDVEKYGALDSRWGLFKRPAVIVGGELKLESVDLRFDPVTRIYEAPLQLKANGGMFLIDDFGRQQISPSELLNRWIVPLEEGKDYLRLRTGQTVIVPFTPLMVFSTNLPLNELAEDTFYHRIQMKVKMDSPTEKDFKKIFKKACDRVGVAYDEESYKHLVKTWYKDAEREMQAAHPRDLLRVILALCNYEGNDFKLTNDLIDEACKSYFIE